MDENRGTKTHRLDIHTFNEQGVMGVGIVDTGCGVPPAKA